MNEMAKYIKYIQLYQPVQLSAYARGDYETLNVAVSLR